MNSIQKLRIKANMTQEQLSALLNVDRSTIAKWETGKAMPMAEKLPDISKALNCTIDELFAEAEVS